MPQPKIANAATPAEHGYSMPAEWEKHEATWLGWPHNASDWPGKFEIIPWVYGEMVRKISAGEKIYLIVRNKSDENFARRVFKHVGVDLRKIKFVTHPTNRGWTRDTGPIFVKRQQIGNAPLSISISTAGRNMTTGARTRKFPKPPRNCSAKNFFTRECDGKPFVIEGGGIELNGRGTLISTEECYLDPKIQVRNPGLGKKEIEATLKNYLGVKNIFWLAKGPKGDDTHGHIDDICRFVNAKTLVLVREKNPRDENYNRSRKIGSASRICGSKTAASRKSWNCPCPRRCILTACGCRRATRIFTSATPPSSSRPSTTRTTAWRSAFWANCSATVPSSAFTPWIWSGASARCTASRSSSRCESAQVPFNKEVTDEIGLRRSNKRNCGIVAIKDRL